MTRDERDMFDLLRKSHDELVLQTLALTAIVGAMAAKQKPETIEVQKWCLALSRMAPGLPPAKLQRRADTILRPSRSPKPNDGETQELAAQAN